MEELKAIGTHILNKDLKDIVLEDVQNTDKCMDLRGDWIAAKINTNCVKLLKTNNFGSNFIIKHHKKIVDFWLITNKHMAILDKDSELYIYLKPEQSMILYQSSDVSKKSK